MHVPRPCGWGALYRGENGISKQKIQKQSDGSSEELINPNCEAKREVTEIYSQRKKVDLSRGESWQKKGLRRSLNTQYFFVATLPLSERKGSGLSKQGTKVFPAGVRICLAKSSELLSKSSTVAVETSKRGETPESLTFHGIVLPCVAPPDLASLHPILRRST